MKPDRFLERLFDAAASAPQEKPGPPPAALESRVLAQWRRGPAVDESALLAGLFRRAAVCAGLIMMVSIVWNFQDIAGAAAGPAAFANYEINAHLPP